MTTTAEVIYEEGALRLLTPVSYPEGTHLSALLTPKPAPDKGDAAYLLTLPRSERNRILAEAAEAAAPEYEADLALQIGERELTEEEMQTRLGTVQAINALAVSHGRLETASRDHDQFLYGPEGAR